MNALVAKWHKCLVLKDYGAGETRDTPIDKLWSIMCILEIDHSGIGIASLCPRLPGLLLLIDRMDHFYP